MGSQRELEIGVLFGEIYWKLFKSMEINKSAYFLIPYVMKMSMHPPKPPRHPNWHIHWKDLVGLGIHQDVDSSCLTPECLEQAATDLCDSFSYYPPDSDEDVIVLQTGFLSDACRTETEGRRERSFVDVEGFIEALGRGTFYSTQARRLPLLVRKIVRRNPNLNLHEDLSILGISQDRMIIPIDQDLMLGFEHRKLMDKFTRTGFGAFMNPMQSIIETIQRINPSVVQKWIPQERIEGFAQETINSLKQAELNIVDF